MSFPNGSDKAFDELILGVDHFTGPSGGPNFYWKCEGCGADGKRKSRSEGGELLNVTTGIGDAWEGYKRHLIQSHSLTPPQPRCAFQTNVDGFVYVCTKLKHPIREAHILEAQ